MFLSDRRCLASQLTNPQETVKEPADASSHIIAGVCGYHAAPLGCEPGDGWRRKASGAEP